MEGGFIQADFQIVFSFRRILSCIHEEQHAAPTEVQSKGNKTRSIQDCFSEG